MTRSMTFVVASLGLAAGTCVLQPQGTQLNGAEPITKNQKLLKLVNSFISQQPWTLEKATKATGMKFTLQTESEEFYDIYMTKCKPTDILKKAEARLPGSRNPKKDGMILLDVSSDVTLTSKDIHARYGDRPAVSSVLFPEQPQDTPIYHLYKFRGGELRFGFSRDGKERLVAVVLDAIEPAKK